MPPVKDTCLIIGIGNEFRGDDAVGLYVVRGLARRNLPNCQFKEAVGEGTYLMDCWSGYRTVTVVDAVKSSTQPGTIHRINARRQSLPANWVRGSSHIVSLPEAIELSKTLGTLPRSLTIIGIEANSLTAGVPLDPRVHKAADELIEQLAEEISQAAKKAGQR